MSKRTLIIATLLFITLGVISRFLPHAWNFAPVTAIAMIAAAYIGFTYSAGLVLAIMALSDISLGSYEWQIMLAVYGSFIVSGSIGYIIRKNRKWGSIVVGSLAASIIFFVVTNLAVWQFSGMYEHSWNGLMTCFVAALPFFRGTLFGDLFFSIVLFALIEVPVRLARRSKAAVVSM